MKDILQEIIGWSVIAIVVLFIFSGLWFGIIKPGEDHNKLCADRMGVHYSWYKGFINASEGMRYDYVDGEHFNCCWDEASLNTNGYYVVDVCKGFKVNET